MDLICRRASASAERVSALEIIFFVPSRIYAMYLHAVKQMD
jgi:hypothetical protein